ncbi:MAG: tetratricopeptide repeat protein [Tepidisphaeraceae bacterium]
MHRMSLLTVVLALALTGCAQTKMPNQKEQAKKHWNDARASVLFGLAHDQYKSGNFDKCRITLNEALKLSPDNAKLHVLSAKLAIEQNQLELAEKELGTAREKDPKGAEADYLSGVVAQRWQKPEAAYGYYTSASEKEPTELAYVLARAEMLVAMDRSPEALSMLQEKVVYFEHSAVIRHAVGQILVQQRRYSEGADMLRQASVLASDDVSIREHLAMAYYFNHQYREACDQFARVLKSQGTEKRAELHLVMGQCQLQLDRLPDARANFEAAARIDPSSIEAWNHLSETALRGNDLHRAELSLRKSLALDANNSEAQLLLGYLRLRQDRLPDALAAFTRASQLDRSDTVSLCMVGYVLQKTGKPEQAMRFYAVALKMRPRDEMASKLMASVDLND